MEQQKFKGVVYLSTEQFEELKANGTIEIEGITLTYEPYATIYVTPDNTNIKEDQLIQTSSALQTQIDEIKTNKKYVHNIVHRIGNTINKEYSIAAFTWINDVAEPYTKNNFDNLIAEIAAKGHISKQTCLLASGYCANGPVPRENISTADTVIGVYVENGSFYLAIHSPRLNTEEILIDGEPKAFVKDFTIRLTSSWKGSQTIGGLQIEDFVTEI